MRAVERWEVFLALAVRAPTTIEVQALWLRGVLELPWSEGARMAGVRQTTFRQAYVDGCEHLRGTL